MQKISNVTKWVKTYLEILRSTPPADIVVFNDHLFISYFFSPNYIQGTNNKKRWKQIGGEYVKDDIIIRKINV